jgi:tRNA pseudouridine55 synthase
MREVARRLGATRAGHAGTLDPAAVGLLILLFGEATKIADWLVGCDKEYLARVRLGRATDTCDAEGRLIAEALVPPGALDPVFIEQSLARYRGEVLQEPPAFSALKRGGRTLMDLARAGEPVSVEPRPVICHALELLGVEGQDIRLRLHVGRGYYVRALARDLGHTLGVPAHLAWLRRTKVGPFLVEEACGPDAASPARLLSIPAALPGTPRVSLNPAEARLVAQGRPVPAAPGAGDRAVLLDEEGIPRALAVRDGLVWKVHRGLNLG